MRRRLGEWAERMPRHMKGRSYLIRASKDVEERFIGNANIFFQRGEGENIETSGESSLARRAIGKEIPQGSRLE